MDTRVVRTSRTALLLGGTALVATACASGGNTSTSARMAGASATGSGGGAVVATAAVGGATRLVSADGHTLYAARGESAGRFLCVGACTGIWEPVAASQQQAQQASSAVGQGFTVAGRPGGGTQLVYDGHPLYVFAREGPRELRGDGVADEFDGTHLEWSAVTTGGSPGARPSMGSKPSDMGGGYGY